MYKYFDVHTHKPSGDDVLSIVNLRFGETPGDGLFSVGLHPRDIGKIPADTAFEAMIQIVASSGCVAVGEAGIDKLIEVPVEFQKTTFERQLLIAVEAKLPIIIHNVRALPEISNSLKKTKFGNPFIFHGFTGKPETARQIVNAGGYIGFGKSLLTHEATRQAFSRIPANRFFLETDDSDHTIYEIYREAANIRNLCRHDLQNIVFDNAYRIGIASSEYSTRR